jgi:hypothetical protein
MPLFAQDMNIQEQETNIVGVVNDSRVRIRKEPNLDGENIGYLNKDQIVFILDETLESMKIGKMDSVWFKIRTLDGIEGWSYGYFIDPDIDSLEVDYDAYLKGYDQDELPNNEDDIQHFLDLYTPSSKIVTNIGSSNYSKDEGTPVYAKYTGKIIDIKWYDNDSSWSELIGFEGRSNTTQGKGLGFYILIQSENEYYIYAHLNPDSKSTQYYYELINNKPNGEELYITKGTQIGEYGMTGTSWDSNLLYVKYLVKSFEELQSEKAVEQ